MIDEQFAPTARGGILYDASRFVKPDERCFTREYWLEAGTLVDAAGGRGGVWFIDTGSGQWVVRHYRRGGAVARLSKDRYLWLGESRTRSFREWRLLQALKRLDLPVPSPIAARYERGLVTYRADLITERLPASTTLAGAVMGKGVGEEDWRAIGSTIAAFHAHGVRHADLNAHNIMLGEARRVYLLDFDRGEIRRRGPWEEAVLARLRRSLDKVGGARLREAEWQALMQGYRGAAKL